MIIGVVKETFPGERRVAVVPQTVPRLLKLGAEVLVERGAGLEAGLSDDEYSDQGARLADSRADVFAAADLVLAIRWLGANPDAVQDDLNLVRPGQVLVGLCEPLAAAEVVQDFAERGGTLLALELLPRITRAQTMDVLSSMAMLAGYKAVLLAADALPKMFPMMITAAGTITAAKVLVVGAGVAGLQAIATARRLGAVVQAYDVRPAVKEEVESLGARFLELPLETAAGEGGYARAMDESFYTRQRELMARAVAASDVVITTAAIPGQVAPRLVTASMVEGMTPGAVIVDLAAERGGNCELTRPGQNVVAHGVQILGPLNLPATLPHDASHLFARNVAALATLLVREGELTIDVDDEVVAGTLAARDGEVVHPRLRERLELEAAERPANKP